MDLIQPTKEIQIKTMAGEDKTYIISKFPAIAGREIVTQYPISAMPKIGEYKVNEDIMFKLMKYVAVKSESGVDIILQTPELINNHVPDWETLGKLEVEMLGYNTSFFLKGKISSFSDTIKAKAEQSILSILTDLLGQLSPQNKQPSKSSKKTTA